MAGQPNGVMLGFRRFLVHGFRMMLLVLFRFDVTGVTERRFEWSRAIVEDFDVIEDGGTGGEAVMVDQLVFGAT
jgi:hypothetical protein